MKVSVIVPTRGRIESLLIQLNALLRQKMPSSEYEIIVVFDGVSDGPDMKVRELQNANSHLRIIDQPQSGAAAARNTGARLAKGKFLAFTDDDCIAPPEWLEKLIAPLVQTSAVAVEGRTVTIRSEMGPLTHQVVNNGNSGVMPTCNAACRRDVFETLGGFEPAFPFPHNEDADLAWRLEGVGMIVQAPDAVMVHPPRLEKFAKRASWVRYLESEFLLFHRNPAAYRRHRSRSPWITIYWNIFIVSQVGDLKNAAGHLVLRRRWDHFVVGIALTFARWVNLVRYFPRFLRASRRLGRSLTFEPERQCKSHLARS